MPNAEFSGVVSIEGASGVASVGPGGGEGAESQKLPLMPCALDGVIFSGNPTAGRISRAFVSGGPPSWASGASKRCWLCIKVPMLHTPNTIMVEVCERHASASSPISHSH
jgi:hypothetical protein